MSYLFKKDYLPLILVLFILLFLTLFPDYYIDLSTDVSTFYSRTSFFINNLSFTNLSVNEYQPGALLFFILLSPILKISDSFEIFRLTLIFANIILVLLIANIYSKYSKAENILLYSLILIFTGPIIFYRFDLLVVTLVLLSFLLWKKKYLYSASFLLGIATLVKIYPVIFLPYLLYINYKNTGLLNALKTFLAYFIGIFSFLFIFILILKPHGSDLFNSLNFHALKSVGLESPWSTIITSYDLITKGSLPGLEFSYGIVALGRESILLPLWFYNYFWIVPFALLHIWLILKYRKSEVVFDIRFCLLNVLSLLIFSKVLAPQYILWFSLLIPLLDVHNLVDKKNWAINFTIILIICLLYQITYPLNYAPWIDYFLAGNYINHLFLVNTLRNLLLVVLFIRLIRDFKNNQLKS